MNQADIEKRKHALRIIIFESDTAKGKLFDVLLIVAVLLSSLVVVLESVTSVRMVYGSLLWTLEWVFAILFSVEYLVRLYCVESRRKYALSFFGVIDLLAILPFFVSLFLPGAIYLMVIRIFRLLRLFRIFKMVRYMEESGVLLRALRNSRQKITVFLFVIFSIVTFVGALMYIIEGPENGFVNIPESMYWAIVTVSTVGYGDISPQTMLGKGLASILMILAYGILAVPTGIISYEIAQANKPNPAVCRHCGAQGHAAEAGFCNQCGGSLRDGSRNVSR